MRHVCGTLVLLALLAPPARAAMGDNDVGVCVHIPSHEVIDLCVELGVGWVRVDNNWLQAVDPCAAMRSFAALDDTVNYAVSQGLNVYMTIAYTPTCASTGDTDGVPNNDVPDAALWEQYVRAAVGHFRALGVRYYGLWNEPNLSGFWEGTAQQYVDVIVVPGLRAIDAGCSDCVALGPELANVGESDVWLTNILNRMDAFGASFDIYSHHIYQGFDVPIWDGDSFLNALEHRRFLFTRAAFLDVLSATGHAPGGVPDREVWITETGYRCQPPTDAAEMAVQRDFYMRVLDEQLARDWYTNSFFYEILDSEDEIDGFGITRRDGIGGYTRKPAFDALRDRIAAEPALSGGTTLPQCDDGDDNDGDTLVDLADPGCASAADDDESDDPPPPPVPPSYDAFPAPAITVDGALESAEWSAADRLDLRSPDHFVSPDHAPGDSDDLSARFVALWSPDSLYLGLDVIDDTQDNSFPAVDIWQGDSLQVAFDMADDGGASAYDTDDDFELGWALTPAGVRKYRWTQPMPTPPESSTAGVVRSSTHTLYEIGIPAADLGRTAFAEGDSFAFTFLVNDADGAGREGWVEWTPGIGRFKEPEAFGTIRLVPVGGADADADDDADADLDVPEEAEAEEGADADADADAADAPADTRRDVPQVSDDDYLGCNCRASASPPPHALWATLVLGLALLRRRRAP